MARTNIIDSARGMHNSARHCGEDASQAIRQVFAGLSYGELAKAAHQGRYTLPSDWRTSDPVEVLIAVSLPTPVEDEEDQMAGYAEQYERSTTGGA